VVMSAGHVVAMGGVEVLEPVMLSGVYGVKLMKIDRAGQAPVLIPDVLV
jgi:ABC-type cobalamin/Fe3+-siderophores transport system ATPase subunit